MISIKRIHSNATQSELNQEGFQPEKYNSGQNLDNLSHIFNFSQFLMTIMIQLHYEKFRVILTRNYYCNVLLQKCPFRSEALYNIQWFL